MTHTLRNQAKRAGIAVAVVAAFSALGTGNALAQQFTSASIDLDRFGNLECNFRETGLTPGGTVRYDCGSQAGPPVGVVGVLQQCFLKNRPVGNSQLLIFQNIHPHEVENLIVKNNGTIFATILTQIPESESNALLCTVPSELTVTAVRWCDNTLVDLTNNITAATVPELFANLVSNGSGNVPSCAVLRNGPFTTPGE